MGFVDHHEVPAHEADLRSLGTRKLVGADDNVVALKRPDMTLADRIVVGLRLKNGTGQKELLQKFLVPLLAEI